MAQSHSFACRWNQLVLINGMEKKETKTAVLCSLFGNLCCLFPLDMFRTTYSKQVPGIVYQVRYLLLSTYCTRHDMYRIDTLYQVRAVGVFDPATTQGHVRHTCRRILALQLQHSY